MSADDLDSRPSLLTPDDLPAVFRAADLVAVRERGRFDRASRARLVLLVLAAAAALIESEPAQVPLGPVLSGAALLAVLGLELFVLRTRADEESHRARVRAESARALAWRYAAGGRPFEVDQPPEAVDRAVLRALLADPTVVSPTGEMSGGQITPAMRALRARPAGERLSAYLRGRVIDQRDWYARAARDHDRRAARWATVLLALESLAVVVALIMAAGLIDVDVLSVVAAVVAAALAWSEAGQHRKLAVSYATAGHGLAGVAALAEHIRTGSDDDRVRDLVDEAEAVIAAEHSLWRARHG
ncbi:MAG: DUF4231 domain-containing protein [Kineosporiaceae bacterium]